MIDLAVALVIGTAFTAVVTAFVADIITPLIAVIGGKPNFGPPIPTGVQRSADIHADECGN